MGLISVICWLRRGEGLPTLLLLKHSYRWIQYVRLELEIESEETRLSPREKSIIVFISNNAGCKSGQIAKRLGIPSPTVKRILPDLIEKNLIEKFGIGPGTNYSVK